jgi:hypothetical protein
MAFKAEVGACQLWVLGNCVTAASLAAALCMKPFGAAKYLDSRQHTGGQLILVHAPQA